MLQVTLHRTLTFGILLVIITGCTGVRQDLGYISSSHVYTANECGLNGEAVNEITEITEAKCKFECLRKYSKGEFI